MSLIKQAGTSAKQNAKQIAKQMAREPLEILKSAARQTGAVPETGHEGQGYQNERREETPKEPSLQEKQVKAEQSKRLMQAFERELEEIKMAKEQEQIQKVQAQVATEQAKEVEKEEKSQNIIQIVSKKGRRMFGKIGLKREQTKVEMRQPPSS